MVTVPLQEAKALVLDFHRAIDDLSTDPGVALAKFASDDYRLRAVHPFDEVAGTEAVASTFWNPLRTSFTNLQRRPDVFMAGHNDVDGRVDGDATTWVAQMGHLVGLFDRPWLDIPPTNRMAFLRYAEFNRVEGDRIAESALFLDVISVMAQAGQYPLPPQTGASFIHPGPRTHDGLLLETQDEAEGRATMDLVNRMVAELTVANQRSIESGGDWMDPAVLARTWHQDMIWYGPEGIGATYTIDRYQQQHQNPFRFNLTDKVFNGHVSRFAEGHYAGFFGWANLTNRPTGGFLGLPGSGPADMRVVDIYRRDGDRLAENWVFIDLLHWLNMQGLDVLSRMRQLNGLEPAGSIGTRGTVGPRGRL